MKNSSSKLVEKIQRLKSERNAIILAHNYQIGEVQALADYVGDSLGLSRIAARTDADVIVFCGVYFMAETSKILSPQKTVLVPDKEARCPMADMISAQQVRTLKEKHPQAKVICYVNTTAEVKAECDLCCTSANAVKVAKSVLSSDVIFVPDKYLADYVSTQTGHTFITWDGYCPAHVSILPEDILKLKDLHPDAEVIVHPECIPEVVKLADEVLSTGGMCKYAKKKDAHEIIVGTETGLLYRLKKENPDKLFHPASSSAVCTDMKLITLEKVLLSLEEMRYEVKVSPDIISRAGQSIQKMLDLA